MSNYLGPQHTQNQAAIYEKKMRDTTYEGETRNWNYDKYTNVHKLAHTRLHGLENYSPPDEGTKIRYHIDNIKDPKLKTVVELVRGNSAYNTFDKVVRRIKDSIVADKSTKSPSSGRTRNVSSLIVKNKKGEEVFPGIEPDMNVEDKFYDRKEWVKLSDAKKKGVLLKRSKRGGGGGSANNGGNNNSNGNSNSNKAAKKRFKKIKKKISKLERRISALNIENESDADESESSSDSDSEQPPKKKSKKTTNRNHPALNRGNNSGGRR
jgi:hypothetical protein